MFGDGSDRQTCYKVLQKANRVRFLHSQGFAEFLNLVSKFCGVAFGLKFCWTGTSGFRRLIRKPHLAQLGALLNKLWTRRGSGCDMHRKMRSQTCSRIAAFAFALLIAVGEFQGLGARPLSKHVTRQCLSGDTACAWTLGCFQVNLQEKRMMK